MGDLSRQGIAPPCAGVPGKKCYPCRRTIVLPRSPDRTDSGLVISDKRFSIRVHAERLCRLMAVLHVSVPPGLAANHQQERRTPVLARRQDSRGTPPVAAPQFQAEARRVDRRLERDAPFHTIGCQASLVCRRRPVLWASRTTGLRIRIVVPRTGGNRAGCFARRLVLQRNRAGDECTDWRDTSRCRPIVDSQRVARRPRRKRIDKERSLEPNPRAERLGGSRPQRDRPCLALRMRETSPCLTRASNRSSVGFALMVSLSMMTEAPVQPCFSMARP